ncbi:archaellin/type IV pilin N-terminal domain-containing protein [Candidatus Nitrosotenuis aquarius]|uniref:archaellin/type IV pilin N-terminal domain-containing protein n=1 Tax=Candidatus Nitrosotenuis aquarius TaxID=1846278 RepID=UPI000E6A5CF7|nr:archaellin/type IV pilin N-terminal domain-containing protein [Candidatus Nitrosotenuis aquarius]
MMKSRRAISEIFATLMLLGITAIGSVMLASLVQGSGISSQDSNTQRNNVASYAIRLIGYDTRDSNDLLGITTLDNKFDQRICTIACNITPNNTPQNSGTEFVVLQIQNTSPDLVYLEGVQINNVLHTWDTSTGGRSLDASANDFTGKYPQNGKFSILSASGLVQKNDNTLSEDEQVRVVVKLSKDLSTDVSLTKPILIQIDFGGARTSDHVILSGEIR